MGLFVLCPACDEDHTVDEVESLNIEENAMGEDIVTFRCIVTNTVQKSRVYGNNSNQSWSIHGD